MVGEWSAEGAGNFREKLERHGSFPSLKQMWQVVKRYEKLDYKLQSGAQNWAGTYSQAAECFWNTQVSTHAGFPAQNVSSCLKSVSW